MGLKQANKCMQLAAIAYNIKKYLKFIEKRTKSEAGMLGLYFRLKTALKEAFKSTLTSNVYQWSKIRKPLNPEASGGLNRSIFLEIMDLCNDYHC